MASLAQENERTCNASVLPVIKNRVASKDFRILRIEEYNMLESSQYTVKQLKEIARAYSLRLSGKREELVSRIYNYFVRSNSAKIIQNAWRRYVVRECSKLRGPGVIYRSRCINETDFFTMSALSDISINDFVSYKCPIDGKVYGFDINSLIRLIEQKNACNPYTRELLPSNLSYNVNRLKRLFNVTNDCIKTQPAEIEPTEIDVITPEKALEFSAINVFHAIDELGNITNYDWFWSLGRIQLIRFIREIADIWGYRAQLPTDMKLQVCPPDGNPFAQLGLQTLTSRSRIELQKSSIEVINRMVTHGVDESARSLGANYVLCALTLVSAPAASAFPWLYDAVAGL